MKSRLNITIDDHLLTSIKTYAASKQMSVSELVEDYFKTIVRPSRRKNILNLIDSLPAPSIGKNADLKDLFYQEQASKYGF